MRSVKRLYEQFQPENYALDLEIDRQTMTFSGKVVISGKKVGRPAKRLTFHQNELKVLSATIDKKDKSGDWQTIDVKRINAHRQFDELRLHSSSLLYPGQYRVSIDFKGKITRSMNGIYPCFFKIDGQDKQLIATQFESHHAREAFPCIDEPQAKATFDLRLTTEPGITVLGNTPIKDQQLSAKHLVTTFETTPRMSSYLLAFVLGELDYREARTKSGLSVRAYATADKVAMTEHGLEVAVQALEFFSNYFGIDYPLPKLDMVALPDFSNGAMENWGLVTFRETALLTDKMTGSIESRQLVALVIAHELSHQWFGNLVTMKWWDDLWLNESFANLMEYRAVDELFPQWQIWQQFVAVETASAKQRDSLADVQPIRCPVQHPDEISTLFDPSIVYAKGGSVLRMLISFIGEDSFRIGLKQYFSKHQYANTTADDLWVSLAAASKQDVATFMNDWLTRPGYPLVNVYYSPGDKVMSLSQIRFISNAQQNVSHSQPWQIPLAANCDLDEKSLVTSQSKIAIISEPRGPLMLNHDGASYFLPHYQDQKQLEDIVAGIQANKVSHIDRLLLLDNYNLLQRCGQSKTTEMLDLIRAYESEDNENVWGSLAQALGEVRRLVENDPLEEKLNVIILKLVQPSVKRLGWQEKTDELAQSLRLRNLILSLAAAAKDKSVVEEGLRRFRKFVEPGDLEPSIRSVVYFIGARYGNDADFNKLLNLHRLTTNAEDKDDLAGGLSATKEPKHYRQLLDLLTTEDIRRQDLIHWFIWLIRNRYSRQATWQWLTQNWQWIEKEFASDKSYGYFARSAGSIFSRESEQEDYQHFFGPKRNVTALRRDIMLGEQEIAGRLAWRQRNEVEVKQWLENHLS
ncbi:MAG TPA: M1 family metallopeptidase [Candidatus Dormibacteraeota bacterium]|nr:M1 family metallopeptidase [Candidatus Dormibacteraeota bacterium]